MKEKVSVVWFRQDLRTSDNSAIVQASKLGKILPIYVFDNCAPHLFKIGKASQVWLHHSLNSLNHTLKGNLNIYKGDVRCIIEMLMERYFVQGLFYNKCYEPWHLIQEKNIQIICKKKSINDHYFNSNYLYLPCNILKKDQSYYKVFSAYKKKSYQSNYRQVEENSHNFQFIKDYNNKTCLSDLNLIPKNEKDTLQSLNFYEVGEVAAQNKLDCFIKEKLFQYRNGRNNPANNQTSFLSPHLHFGEISASQVFESVKSYALLYADDLDVDHFLSEIMWREFSCYLLYHFSFLHKKNLNNKFDRFPWFDNSKYFNAWKTGQTGYPIVDAGMRQLLKTWYMHNRARMIVASFLVKNLNIHWHRGRDWFWNYLFDADLANNSMSWQWVAGCGVDAMPYFRIFNPVTQGEKFDKNGEYTRLFVPELEKIPNKYLFKQWTASTDILESSGIILGKNYPKPIVDWVISRKQALESYREL